MRSGSATISRTVIRGFSDAYGSWKTIWRSLRTGRSSRLERFVMSRPSKRILPAVGSKSLMIVRPSVVFPEPDSPTTPSVSRSRTARSMPSTALTCATVCLKTPALTGKCLTRPSTRRSSSPLRRRHRAHVVGSTFVSRATSSSAKWHADRCSPSVPSARSIGTSVLQVTRPRDSAQRGWNAQPGGSVIRLGGWPGIGSRSSVSASSRARLARRPAV